MIRTLMIKEFQKHGADENLVDRLLKYGEKHFVTWLTHKYCKPVDGQGIYETLEAFAVIADRPFKQIHWSYYKTNVTPIRAIRARYEYVYLLSVLIDKYPFPELWNELMPFAYTHVKKLAVELEVINGTNIWYIQDKLNVKKSMAYDIRKQTLLTYVKERGDYGNDTKYN